MLLTTNTWNLRIHREIKKVFEKGIALVVSNLNARVINFETKFLKEASEFLRDYKSLEKEADESLEKVKHFENDNDHPLEAVVITDIMSIIAQTYSSRDYINLQTELLIKIVKYENYLERLEKKHSFFQTT